MAEHLTVDQVVVGSTPITHPENKTRPANELVVLLDQMFSIDHQVISIEIEVSNPRLELVPR